MTPPLTWLACSLVATLLVGAVIPNPSKRKRRRPPLAPASAAGA